MSTLDKSLYTGQKSAQWIKVSKLSVLDRIIKTETKNNKTNMPTFALHTFLINLKLILHLMRPTRLHRNCSYFPNVYNFFRSSS